MIVADVTSKLICSLEDITDKYRRFKSVLWCQCCKNKARVLEPELKKKNPAGLDIFQSLQ